MSRVCTQPANVVSGCLYIGLTKNSDEDLKMAHTNGASAIVTNREVEGLSCLVVPDVNRAYCDISAGIKRRFSAKTVLITGSFGKTTTKEILERVLACKHRTLASSGNSNTRHTGLLTMQRLREYHGFYVQEVYEGERNSAEMLSRGLMPDYAIITNMDSHGGESTVSDEEFSRLFTDITAGLKEDGILFVNGDDDSLMKAVKALNKTQYRIETFGVEQSNLDHRAENICSHDGWLSLDIVYGDFRVPVKMRSPVEKNAYSIAAAFAVGLAAGLEPQNIADAVSDYESGGMRQNVVEYRGLKMMLDCRSAMPASMESAIQAFCTLLPKPGGKRVVVIGDMSLSGENAEREHRRIGKRIASTNIDCLLCYGRESRYVYEEAVTNGFPASNAIHCETKRKLEKLLYNLLEAGDTLLIKGGSGMYLNSTIRKLFGCTFSYD